jgi:hypothetical protein
MFVGFYFRGSMGTGEQPLTGPSAEGQFCQFTDVREGAHFTPIDR